MIGLLKVVERASGEVVATLHWSGTLWGGSGKWEAEPSMVKRLGTIVAARSDLAGVSFGDMLRDGNGVRGWQGFSGWLQALGLALPAYGLDIDAASIEWPFKRPDAAVDAGNADLEEFEIDG